MAAARKVVIVTGCSSGGIGFSLCEQFALHGCKVYATSRKADTITGLSDPTIERLALDVTSDDDVQRVVGHILKVEGRIDVVVNNAGILGIGPVIDLPLEQVQRTFDTNAFSILRLAKAVMPAMANRQSGLIVNIGSVSAEFLTPWNGLYSASKAAMHTLSEALAMECKPFSIDVMLVAPGAVKSNISKNQAATFKGLPAGSLYGAYLENIVARMNFSQSKYSMQTDLFAEQVVRKALSRRPPSYLSLGGYRIILGIFKWLPRSWMLTLMWKHFSK